MQDIPEVSEVRFAEAAQGGPLSPIIYEWGEITLINEMGETLRLFPPFVCRGTPLFMIHL